MKKQKYPEFYLEPIDAGIIFLLYPEETAKMLTEFGWRISPYPKEAVRKHCELICEIKD